jgi:hypothetical protein
MLHGRGISTKQRVYTCSEWFEKTTSRTEPIIDTRPLCSSFLINYSISVNNGATDTEAEVHNLGMID